MPILVVKFGTKELCDESGKLDQIIFDDFARQLAEVQERGIGVVIVSSGAIQAGREEAKIMELDPQLDKKEFAGVGSPYLLNRWIEAFAAHRRLISQVWVTYANWQDQNERQSIKNSLLDFARQGIIPVVNENDVVSDREIRLMDLQISENDRLCKMVARLVNADMLLFLTEVGGVYEEDPNIQPRARFYREIDAAAVPATLKLMGGMTNKVAEAIECQKAGMKVAIAGREENVIVRFVNGESVGTKIGTSTRLKDPG